MSTADYVTNLAAAGRHSFTTRDAEVALGKSPVAIRAALRRLAIHGAIASPIRGFHVIVPPEYRRLGCLPPDQFVPDLMAALGLDYYVGLVSAAQYHGAGHHRPQAFFVMVEKNRDAIECGAVRVEFVAKKQVAKVPTVLVNTLRGTVSVASPEATALDLVGYSSHVGGLDAVATVLAELAERIDPDALVAAAKSSPLTWAQRLGHLLDRVDAGPTAQALHAYVAAKARDFTPLQPAWPSAGAPRDPKWYVAINVVVEPDL